MDKVFKNQEVIPAGKEFAESSVSITAGPPSLLSVVFEGFGKIVMDDSTDVGLIDSHSEGDCGGNDRSLS